MTFRNRRMEQRCVMRMECGELYVREAGEGEVASRTITGYAILFGVASAPLVDDEDCEVREVIAPGAITDELLGGCDIKFTMFHDNHLILARSNGGKGTLSYEVDERGVKFEFDAPNTVDGDKALELVRRGDISGCSFAFTTCYGDPKYVERKAKVVDGRQMVTYTVRVITGVYDFTLTADPAYPATSVEARGIGREFEVERDAPVADKERVEAQVREMRRAAEVRW